MYCIVLYCIADEEPLLDDDLDKAEGWKLWQVNKAEYKPFRMKLADEEKVTFFASIREGEKKD